MKSPFHQSPKPLEIVPRCRQSATAWVTPRQPNAKYPMNSETVRVGTEMVNQHVLSTSIDVIITYNNHIYITMVIIHSLHNMCFLLFSSCFPFQSFLLVHSMFPFVFSCVVSWGHMFPPFSILISFFSASWKQKVTSPKLFKPPSSGFGFERTQSCNKNFVIGKSMLLKLAGWWFQPLWKILKFIKTCSKPPTS